MNMEYHTLVFDTEVGEEDVRVFEQCEGVVGVSGYSNAVNIYYKNPLGKQEVMALLAVVHCLKEFGINLVSTDIDEMHASIYPEIY